MGKIKITVTIDEELNEKLRAYIWNKYKHTYHGKLSEVVNEALEKLLANQ